MAQGKDSERDGGHADAERARRMDALQRLAGEQRQSEQPAASSDAKTAPPAHNFVRILPPARIPRRRMWRRAALLVLCLAGIVAIVLLKLPKAAPRTAPLVDRQIVPGADNITCLVDAALAPDGAYVAVAGYADHCPHGTITLGYEPGIIGIYDVKKRQLLQKLSPDDAIVSALHLDLNQQSATVPGISQSVVANNPGMRPTLTIMYQAIVWSPDGTQLALTFVVASVYYGPGGANDLYNPRMLPGPITAGVLLLDASGGHARVLATPYQENQPTVEWDLSAGARIHLETRLPAALAYQWGADGTLEPLTRLSTATVLPVPPLAAIGNPVGGASFSIWQSGQGGRVNYWDAQGDLQPALGLYFWLPSFVAWSPDQRYLLVPGLAPLRTVGQRIPPGDPAVVASAGYNHTPLLSLRDAPSRNLYDEILPDTALTTNLLSWRPDGQVVAIPGFDGNATVVRLYNCATGEEVATLAETNSGRRTDPNMNSYLLPLIPFSGGGRVEWTGDGTHLMFLDSFLGIVTVWSGAQLPQ